MEELLEIVERILSQTESLKDYRRFDELIEEHTRFKKAFFYSQLKSNEFTGWPAFYQARRKETFETFKCLYITGIFKGLLNTLMEKRETEKIEKEIPVSIKEIEIPITIHLTIKIIKESGDNGSPNYILD